LHLSIAEWTRTNVTFFALLNPGGWMISGFEKIVEERIRKAIRNGEFEDLPGSGEPLALQDDSHIPEDLRLAYKILKNAECLPPEIELRKDIEKAEDILAAMPDTAEKYQALKKLNFLILKLNAARRGSIDSEMPQHYVFKVVSRIEIRKK
jgi:hypothetical protein